MADNNFHAINSWKVWYFRFNDDDDDDDDNDDDDDDYDDNDDDDKLCYKYILSIANCMMQFKLNEIMHESTTL